MVEDLRAGPVLQLLQGMSGAVTTTSVPTRGTRGRRRGRRKGLPSLSVAVAPLVHWVPGAARDGDAFRWAGAMSTLVKKGDPFVLLLHGGLRSGGMSAAGSEAAAAWRPYAAWVARHQAAWRRVCRGVIVITPEIAARIETRNDAQWLFGKGTRVVAVSQETLAWQLAPVLMAERTGGRAGNDAGTDVVVRGLM
ncbi:hypothetical protein [Robbsia andropogonis]|uniref:hypothetical protein n=1 Tax=Robbsia andropogonis TaxID=28092 RepID=UPI00046500FB|nr:hypothetical protein [Robbsia andropogonis]MCP1120264.1 hypothetical protein [Robbsia andropogonis]MCP1130090.1 hypothetical protein [Robbsia andropogonis]